MIAGPRARRALVSVLACAVVMPASAYWFGARGFCAAVVLMVLWLAWRHDNEVGVCLPLAILMLIVVAVMGLLIYLMLITHQGLG